MISKDTNIFDYINLNECTKAVKDNI